MAKSKTCKKCVYAMITETKIKKYLPSGCASCLTCKRNPDAVIKDNHKEYQESESPRFRF